MSLSLNLQGIVYSLVATASLAVLLVLLRLLVKRLNAWIESLEVKSEVAVRIQQVELLSGKSLRRAVALSVRIAHISSALLLIYFYIPIVLSLFPWTEPLAKPFLSYFAEPFRQIWAAIVDYSPSLLHILAIILFSWLILKILRMIFLAMRAGYIVLPGFHEEWSQPTYKIIRFLVLGLTFVMIFPFLPGSDSPAFKGVSLFVGAMVTLGSTAAMGNVTAGVLLIYSRSFSVGNYVKIGETYGCVIERTLLTTRLRTAKQEIVSLPNSVVLSSHVVNYSTAVAEGPGVIVHSSIGLGYDIDWRKVHELLKSAALGTEHIESEPEPFILQKSLDEFSVAYELNAHTKRPDLLPGIYSELNRNILDEFSRAKIEILSPHFTSMRDGNSLTIPKKA